MLRGSLGALAAVAALVVPAASGASTIEHVQVAGPGVTSAFPTRISIKLASPPAYAGSTASGSTGTWLGPAYWANGNRAVGGQTSLNWAVSFTASRASAQNVALAAPAHPWPLDKKDSISVQHVVGERAVGTVPGFYVIRRAPPPDDAAYQALIAFPLGPGAFAIVTFGSAPTTDSAGAAGTYLVGGGDPPSLWNRGQILWAMASIGLVGNLPATRVVLTSSGHVLRGSVADAFRNPVVRVPVSLERRRGGSWRVATRTKTNTRGHFTVHAGRGTYRAVVRGRTGLLVSQPVSKRG